MLSMISIPVTALAVGFPRSGLSRSDLVLWPEAAARLPRITEIGLGADIRQTLELDVSVVNDPGCVKTLCLV